MLESYCSLWLFINVVKQQTVEKRLSESMAISIDFSVKKVIC